MPGSIEPWLYYKSSLTAKVRSTGSCVQVLVLNERWERAHFKRDVLILCDNKPCWYARTIIPKETYVLRLNELTQLNDEPIGNILYSDPNISLKRRCIFSIKKESIAFIKHEIKPEVTHPLWSRRSTFLVEQSPLYLMEFFLPNLPEHVPFYD